jgi:hypothetical protein
MDPYIFKVERVDEFLLGVDQAERPIEEHGVEHACTAWHERSKGSPDL